MADRVLRGRASATEMMLAPMVRALLLGTGALSSLALWWLGFVWTAPAPLIVSAIGYYYVLKRRQERSCSVTVGEALRVEDPLRKQQFTLAAADVWAASLRFRPSGADTAEIFVVLADRERVRLGVRVHTSRKVVRPQDLDLTALAATLGADGGILRAMGPTAALLRQEVDDPDGALIAWVRNNVPEAAFGRAIVRAWEGAEPELDVLGNYVGPHSVEILADEQGLSVRRGDVTKALRSSEITVLGATRHAILMQFRGEKAGEHSSELQLLCLELGPGTWLAVPAEAGRERPRAQPGGDWLHTHAAEATWLVGWLLQRGLAPAALVERAAVARQVNLSDTSPPPARTSPG